MCADIFQDNVIIIVCKNDPEIVLNFKGIQLRQRTSKFMSVKRWMLLIVLKQ